MILTGPAGEKDTRGTVAGLESRPPGVLMNGLNHRSKTLPLQNTNYFSGYVLNF